MLVRGGMDPQRADLISGGGAMTAGQRTSAWRAFRIAAERDVTIRDPTDREKEIRRRVDAAMAALDEDMRASSAPVPLPPPDAPPVPQRDQGAAPAAPAQTPREGQTATNRATGQRMIFRNGRWEPLQ